MPSVPGEYFPFKSPISRNLNKCLCRFRGKAIADEGRPSNQQVGSFQESHLRHTGKWTIGRQAKPGIMPSLAKETKGLWDTVETRKRKERKPLQPS